MSTPRKPDLDQLITALTADARPKERADRNAALAAFRAASQGNAANVPASATVRQRGVPFRRPLIALPTRLAAAGAALVLVIAGVAAAAYTQALPAPVQALAHTVFAPLGVPNSQPPAGAPAGTGSSALTIATSGAPKTASPRPGEGYAITVAVSRARVSTGGRVAFTGRVTDRRHAAPRVRVRLYERLADTKRFELVATGVTGPLGGFRLPSPPLTATAVFRVAGPDSARSVAVRVAVTAARVTASASAAEQPQYTR